MEDYQAQESVVEASVDAGNMEDTQDTSQASESHVEGEEAVVERTVDASKPDNNGEAIRREVERREAKMKQQYESQMEEIRKENAYLDKQAQIYGYRDRHEYKKAVDDHFKQQEIEREAQRMGVDPDTYSQYFAPVNQQLSELQHKVQTYEQQQTERQRQEVRQAQWGELYSQYPGLVESSSAFNDGKNPDWYSQEMQELIGMGYKPVHAYELAHKNTLFQQKEQEALARVLGRDQKQVLPSKDSPNNVQFDPANMSFEEIQAISERVRRGERITF